MTSVCVVGVEEVDCTTVAFDVCGVVVEDDAGSVLAADPGSVK